MIDEGSTTIAVDLETENVLSGSIMNPPAIGGVATVSYNPAQDREQKRGQIAMWLIYLLIALSLAPFVLILVRGVCVAAAVDSANIPDGTCSGLPIVELMDVLTLVITPVVALVGAATGFYFGAKSGDT